MQNQRAAIGMGREEARSGFEKLKAVAFELHVFEDRRSEWAVDGVENGGAEAGMKFFRDCGTADGCALFQDEGLVSRAGEIKGGDEAVRAGADDDDVTGTHWLVGPQVFEDFEGGETAGRAHDAAAGMGGGAAHVEIFDRRAIASPSGDRAKEEKLFERKFALENIAFGETDLLLDVERSEDLPADDDVFEIGGVLRNRVDDGVAEFLAATFPRTGFEFVGRVLHEAGEDVLAGRRDGSVGKAGNDHVNVG